MDADEDDVPLENAYFLANISSNNIIKELIEHADTNVRGFDVRQNDIQTDA